MVEGPRMSHPVHWIITESQMPLVGIHKGYCERLHIVPILGGIP